MILVIPFALPNWLESASDLLVELFVQQLIVAEHFFCCLDGLFGILAIE